MAQFTSWEEFVKSNHPVLNSTASDFYLEKGQLNFIIEAEGVKYFCSGSHCDMSSMEFNPSLPIKAQCDFDYFWAFEVGNQSNELCNW